MTENNTPDDLADELQTLATLLKEGSFIDCGDGLYQLDAKKELEIRRRCREVYKKLFGDIINQE